MIKNGEFGPCTILTDRFSCIFKSIKEEVAFYNELLAFLEICSDQFHPHTGYIVAMPSGEWYYLLDKPVYTDSGWQLAKKKSLVLGFGYPFPKQVYTKYWKHLCFHVDLFYNVPKNMVRVSNFNNYTFKDSDAQLFLRITNGENEFCSYTRRGINVKPVTDVIPDIPFMYPDVFLDAHEERLFINCLYDALSKLSISSRYNYVVMSSTGRWYVFEEMPIRIDDVWIKCINDTKDGWLEIPFSFTFKNKAPGQIWEKCIFRINTIEGDSEYSSRSRTITHVDKSFYRGQRYYKNASIEYIEQYCTNSEYFVAKNKSGSWHLFFEAPEVIGDQWLCTDSKRCCEITKFIRGVKQGIRGAARVSVVFKSLSTAIQWDLYYFHKKLSNDKFIMVNVPGTTVANNVAPVNVAHHISTSDIVPQNPHVENVSILPKVHIVTSSETHINFGGIVYEKDSFLQAFDTVFKEPGVYVKHSSGFSLLRNMPSVMPPYIISRGAYVYAAMNEVGGWHLYNRMPFFDNNTGVWFIKDGDNIIEDYGMVDLYFVDMPEDPYGAAYSLHKFHKVFDTYRWTRHDKYAEAATDSREI